MSSFVASHRNARISAQKVRLVADLVRGQFADEALDTLKYQPQRGARMLEKVIQSAVANALDPEQTGGRPYTIDELVLSDVRIDGGPMFRRMRPRARGSAHIIKKRSSHISVKVTPVDEILEGTS
ncbi:MAG: 50S ribosomal protein L22 [Planctomycetota bacterium]